MSTEDDFTAVAAGALAFVKAMESTPVPSPERGE